MDLRVYYQKIRDAVASVPTEFAVMISHSTGDGGQAGVAVEVTRQIAARMLVEGTAKIASAEQAAEFQLKKAAEFQNAAVAAAAARVEVTMVPSDDLKRLADDVRKLKGSAKAGKE